MINSHLLLVTSSWAGKHRLVVHRHVVDDVACKEKLSLFFSNDDS